jgi:sulfhydrogenase subunit beta (sulfur reductase)
MSQGLDGRCVQHLLLLSVSDAERCMSVYIVYLDQVPSYLEEWSREFSLFVPGKIEQGLYDFLPWSKDVEISWDYDVAYNTLKRFFLPPREELIRFELSNSTSVPVVKSQPTLLFAVHPYDIKAINQLDQLMEGGSADVNYRARRDATIIFGFEPQRIAPSAFWSSVGAGRVEHGFDLYWTRISPAAFMVEVGSPKGEELLSLQGRAKPQKATLAEREAARRERNRIRKQAGKHGLQYPWEATPKVLAKSWDSMIWKDRARECLSCGSCVMVCPTCYCFDVQEEVDDLLKGGTRYRIWDGCMLSGFAAIAGGHNFRAAAWERYRHRYFRKGKYIYDRIGELGCVGCGRCVRACTANIANPMEIFNTLWEEVHHED